MVFLVRFHSFNLIFFFFFILQSRQESSSLNVPDGSKVPSPIVRKTKLSTILQSIRPPSTGLADITAHSCATPPQHRRRIFNRKNIRSPFGHRQSSSVAGDINSTFSGKHNYT